MQTTKPKGEKKSCLTTFLNVWSEKICTELQTMDLNVQLRATRE